MCLGIVGQVVTIDALRPDLAEVDVAGAVRQINIGIIADEGVGPGDWILIHAGFAMEKIDAETAANQTAALRAYTGPSGLDGDDIMTSDPLLDDGTWPTAVARGGGPRG